MIKGKKAITLDAVLGVVIELTDRVKKLEIKIKDNDVCFRCKGERKYKTIGGDWRKCESCM